MGDSIEPSLANGLVYQCTDIAANNAIGFTDPAVEPIWPVVIGGTVVDGDVTWTCFGPTPPTFRSFGQVN